LNYLGREREREKERDGKNVLGGYMWRSEGYSARERAEKKLCFSASKTGGKRKRFLSHPFFGLPSRFHR
jgi:hypothetical protein